jgi:hypothetical protein
MDCHDLHSVAEISESKSKAQMASVKSGDFYSLAPICENSASTMS